MSEVLHLAPASRILAPLTDSRRARAVERSDSISVREVRGKSGLRAIHADWSRVLAGVSRTRRLHHLPEWAEARLSALEVDDENVRFYVLYRGEAPVGVFPLRATTLQRGGLPLRALEIPRCDSKTHADFVFEPGESTRDLVAHLVQHLRAGRSAAWDVLHLPSLHDDSAAIFALREEPPAGAVVQPAGSCSMIRCLPWEEVEKGLKKSFRGNLRRARNKLLAIPSHEFLSTRDPQKLPRFLDALLEVEASGWKGARGTSTAIKHSPRQASFFRALVERMGAIGACEVNLLAVEGRCIAGQLCFIVGDTTTIAKIGYDEEYAKLAPGQMLLEELIRRSHRDGRRFVNLSSDAAWTHDWNPESVPMFQALVFNWTPLGLLGLAGCKLLSLLKRAEGRWRALETRIRRLASCWWSPSESSASSGGK